MPTVEEEFLKQFCAMFKIDIDAVKNRIQIMNGLKHVDSLQISLIKEKIDQPPYGSLDLRPYVLDNESL